MATEKKALWADQPLDSRQNYFLEVAESYTGISIRLPVYVLKGKKAGPSLFVTAAVHGDEINGTGTIRELIAATPFELERGTLVLIPVVNIQGFERQTRYLPDRRDLNRYFPGNKTGSVTSRLADVIFQEVIEHCDYGIDLHSASVRRTNFPHIRSDMSNPITKQMATCFGTEIIIDATGPEGSLRYEANKANCPTIILEAGEVWKVETSYIEIALRGICNVLKNFNMIEGEIELPEYQITSNTTRWVRAQSGGFLQFHVSPGDTVSKDQKLSTNTDLLGNEVGDIIAPCNGVIIGMTTIPSVAPGDPVFHIAVSSSTKVHELEVSAELSDDESLESRSRDNFATNIHIIEDKEDLYG